MTYYCIPGLGADERVFQNLDLPNKSVIKWITPNPNESLTSYCNRLLTQIDTSGKFTLLGVSFGGIIACELNRLLPVKPEKVILISSFVDKIELPLLFRAIGNLGLHKLVPHQLMKPPMWLAYKLFGVTESADKRLLKSIIDDTDTYFLKWAIGQVLNNEAIHAPGNLIRIHGREDKVIPIPKNCKLVDGGHFAIVTHHQSIFNYFSLIT